MSRSTVELFEVLKAMVDRLQGLEERVQDASRRQEGLEERVEETTRRQSEFDDRVMAIVERALPERVALPAIEEFEKRLGELESEVADARMEASRGGEQLKALLGDLVFDDKAAPADDGTPRFVQRRAPEHRIVDVEPTETDEERPRDTSAPVVENEPSAKGGGRFLGAVVLAMLLVLAAGFGLGTMYGNRGPEPVPFSVPQSCTELQPLAARGSALQQVVSSEYGKIAAAALSGDAEIATEQLLPADKAMATLAENTSAVVGGVQRCLFDLSGFESSP